MSPFYLASAINRPALITRWKFYLLAVCMTCTPSCSSSMELKSFTTDGCSAFPDGTRQEQGLWQHCCTAHDCAYWKGGTRQQRKAADKALKVCVANVGQPEIANLMLAGVKVGGTPYLPTSFRWGYGWSYPRFYGPLTGDELKRTARMVERDAQNACAD